MKYVRISFLIMALCAFTACGKKKAAEKKGGTEQTQMKSSTTVSVAAPIKINETNQTIEILESKSLYKTFSVDGGKTSEECPAELDKGIHEYAIDESDTLLIEDEGIVVHVMRVSGNKGGLYGKWQFPLVVLDDKGIATTASLTISKNQLVTTVSCKAADIE